MDPFGCDGQQAGGEVVIVNAVLLFAEPQIGKGDHLFEARPGAEAVDGSLFAHLLKEGSRFGGCASAQQFFGQFDLLAELLHGVVCCGLAAQPVNAVLAQIDVVLGVGASGEGSELPGHALSAGSLVGIGSATC